MTLSLLQMTPGRGPQNALSDMEYYIYKQLLITHLRKVVCYDKLRLYPWLTTNVPVEELLLQSECNSPIFGLKVEMRYKTKREYKKILFQKVTKS